VALVRVGGLCLRSRGFNRQTLFKQLLKAKAATPSQITG